MLGLEIKINRIGEGTSFPELAGLVDGEAYIRNVSILEGGMVSGKTSLYFCIQLASGRYVGAQMSADLFRGLAAALAGAEERFKDSPLA